MTNFLHVWYEICGFIVITISTLTILFIFVGFLLAFVLDVLND